jgi:ubiquinone/menaquinone biosynthesis C-methylase UbiE
VTSALGARDVVRYRWQHASLLGGAVAIGRAARAWTREPRRALPAVVERELRRRALALHAADLANVNAGYYPRDLLFDVPLRDYARALPRLLVDLPVVARRRAARAYKEVPTAVAAGLPAYYRRTFHWQTDGYLSDRSAALYDVGVELLFGGMADVMRRQILPPVARWLAARGGTPADVRVLDVACGTGAALRQLTGAWPTMRYLGVDLSSPYLAHAARRLRGRASSLELALGNAEALALPDASVDVVTCVYLMHELPRNVRRRVARELRRVLAPGGLLVVEDSAQLAESATIAPALHQFAADFHEPFYEDYLTDELGPMLAECGFAVTSSAPHLVAKVVVATPA